MQTVRSKNFDPEASKEILEKKIILKKKMRSKFVLGVHHPRCWLRDENVSLLELLTFSNKTEISRLL